MSEQVFEPNQEAYFDRVGWPESEDEGEEKQKTKVEEKQKKRPKSAMKGRKKKKKKDDVQGGGRRGRRRTRRRKTKHHRRKRRKKTRKQRGGGWRQVWPGGAPDTLTEAIALLNNLPKSQRIRISLPEEDWNEHRLSNAARSTWARTDPLKDPLEFNAKEGLEDGEETARSDVRRWTPTAMRYQIFFPGAEGRTEGLGGALVDYPFKIEVWEEEQKKRPKSAMKTSGKRSEKQPPADEGGGGDDGSRDWKGEMPLFHDIKGGRKRKRKTRRKRRRR